MSDSRRLLPEEQELDRKRVELEEMQSLLADRELELASIRARLIAFEQNYMEKVGSLYVELDDLEAQVANWRSERDPHDRQTAQEAKESRQRADASRSEYEHKKGRLSPTVQTQESTQELKSLYRKLAKQFHPDMALDPQEKTRRSVIMVQVNDAYALGNLDALRQLNDELSVSPDAVPGDGIGAELIRVIRKIAQIDRRLTTIEEEIIDLEKSDIFRLAKQYDEYKNRGQDLLDILASDVRRRIVERQAQLAIWRSNGLDSDERVVPPPA